MHYIYLPIIFWPIFSSVNDIHIPVYVRYEPTLVYGLDNKNPYTYITDDCDEMDYEPYTHHFLPEDGSEDSCYEPTK
jgi:hypothetical protein